MGNKAGVKRGPYKKKILIFGVGVNDADYVVQVKEIIKDDIKFERKLVWVCPFYQTWKHMLERGYSSKLKEKYPTYNDVTVCEEWHIFSNFKRWAEQQPLKLCQLDKDLLITGNKVYSPDTCVFVPGRVNTLLVDSGVARGKQPLGVSYSKKPCRMINELTKPYVASVNNGEGGHSKYLGMFATSEEAHKAWQLAKADVIDETVMWWQFDSEVNHSFRQDVAESLFRRADLLRSAAKKGVETVKL